MFGSFASFGLGSAGFVGLSIIFGTVPRFGDTCAFPSASVTVYSILGSDAPRPGMIRPTFHTASTLPWSVLP
jgi:hypothetical protein